MAHGIPQESRQPALRLIATINNDYYRSEVLKELISQPLSDEETAFLLDKVVQEVRSDHFRNEIMESLLANQRNMSSSCIDLLIAGIGNTRSDHYRAESPKSLMSHQNLSARNYESLYIMLLFDFR